MSEIQITKTYTIDRATSVHDDKAIRCERDCFHCSRQYGECDLFPFSKREYHQSDNTWSPCQDCIDAERKADKANEYKKGYNDGYEDGVRVEHKRGIEMRKRRL